MIPDNSTYWFVCSRHARNKFFSTLSLYLQLLLFGRLSGVLLRLTGDLFLRAAGGEERRRLFDGGGEFSRSRRSVDRLAAASSRSFFFDIYKKKTEEIK